MLNWFKNLWTKVRVFTARAEDVKNDILSLLNANSTPRGTSLTYEDAYIIVNFEHMGNDGYNYEIFVKTGTENLRVYHRYRDNQHGVTNINVYRKGYWIIYLKNMLDKNVSDVQYFKEKRVSNKVIRDNVSGVQTVVKVDSPPEPQGNTRSLDAVE